MINSASASLKGEGSMVISMYAPRKEPTIAYAYMGAYSLRLLFWSVPHQMLAILTSTVGSSVTKIAWRTSMNTAIRGVDTIGKPIPIPPCTIPANTITPNIYR